MDVEQLVRELDLQPHPEGGWYREFFRSPCQVETPRGRRSAVTSIYYLLSAGERSRWHVVEADEIWHFCRGEALELITYNPESRRLAKHRLASSAPARQMAVVPAGVWQAARPHGEWSLMGCTVGPGFDFDDFRLVAALAGHAEHFSGSLNEYTHLL